MNNSNTKPLASRQPLVNGQAHQGATTQAPLPGLTEEQHGLLADIRLMGARELAEALEHIHDLALYHTTEHPIELYDKEALLNIKTLWQALIRLAETMEDAG